MIKSKEMAYAVPNSVPATDVESVENIGSSAPPAVTTKAPATATSPQMTIRKCQRAGVYLLVNEEAPPCNTCGARFNCNNGQSRLPNGVQEVYVFDPADKQLTLAFEIEVDGNDIRMI